MRRTVTRSLWRLAVGMSQERPLDTVGVYERLKAWWLEMPRKERNVRKLRYRAEEWLRGVE